MEVLIRLLIHVVAFLVGGSAIGIALKSAVQTFILPRGIQDRIARIVFLSTRFIFGLRASGQQSYEDRDRIMAFYAPAGLLALITTWLVMVEAGYTLAFWALGVGDWARAFAVSGSSMFTLGFATPKDSLSMVLVFSEAAIGLLLVALLITYLPTIYSAWSRREAGVASLEVRAGSPPTAWNIIIRFSRMERLTVLDDLWPEWEIWFTDLEQSHTSLASLSFFRSPQPDQSWVAAAGVILDAAALMSSTVDLPRDPRRELLIRSGYVALRRIATFFYVPYDDDPNPDDPISIAQEEYNEIYDLLAEQGVPLKPDREESWGNFAGWRVNYDEVLLGLAALTMAAYAPWVSDRSARWQHPLRSWLRQATMALRGRG